MNLRSLAAASLFASVPAVASADVSADVNAWYFTQDAYSVFSPDFRLQVPIGMFDIEAKWALALTTPKGGSGQFNAMNPYLGATYGIDLSALEIQFGLGLSFPVFQLSDDTAGLTVDGAASERALGMRGGWDAFIYLPDSFGIVVPVRVIVGLPVVKVVGEVSPYYLIATGDPPSRFGLQIGAEVILSVIPVLDFGARLQAIATNFTLSDDANRDDFQLSLEPFVGASVGPLHARLGFLLNLDAPAGFSFDSGKVWGLHLGVGVSF